MESSALVTLLIQGRRDQMDDPFSDADHPAKEKEAALLVSASVAK